MNINKEQLGDELEKAILDNPLTKIPTLNEAIALSKKHKLALHPRYTLYWNELSASAFLQFLEELPEIRLTKTGAEFPLSEKLKQYFEVLGIEHTTRQVSFEENVKEDEAFMIVLEKKDLEILSVNLGINLDNITVESYNKVSQKLEKDIKEDLTKVIVKVISDNSPIEIRDKGGFYIGARMGRPEKAKLRKLDGRPHGLFPVGHVKKVIKNKRFNSPEDQEQILQNRLRNIMEAAREGTVQSEFSIYTCVDCGKENVIRKCVYCGGKTEINFFHRYDGTTVKPENEMAVQYRKTSLDLEPYITDVRKKLKSAELPKLVKGIKGTSNKHRVTEHLLKAFLREKNGVYVNKDGTVRYDMIEMGITHFKPFEIGTSIEKLKELGYTMDRDGNPLERDDQIVEMFPQDVILPDCHATDDEIASDYVMNTGNYVDELLEKLYEQEPFYNFKSRDDTVGHLVVGLAPHTSAGIIGRILGYSKTQGCFSHPVWHAAQRRNLDGDENGIMLLLDALINFSRDYLPDRRGSRTMDTALVLTSHLYLDQIDDEVHGMDIVDHYPLELYRAAKEFKSAKEIKIETVNKRIDEKVFDEKYLGYSFTHDTDDFNDTILCSSYKTIPSMIEKMDMQLDIGNKIRAVDEDKVGSFIIDKHFMKDIKGNLRKFSMQKFRCTKCNTIYRRPPLVGKCTNCGEPSINFTIAEGSIKKYLDPSFRIVSEYDVDPYIVETLELVNLRIEGVFGKELEKQKSLGDYFSK